MTESKLMPWFNHHRGHRGST